jgi:hypothetical protein
MDLRRRPADRRRAQARQPVRQAEQRQEVEPSDKALVGAERGGDLMGMLGR